jgi:hypothetical protein
MRDPSKPVLDAKARAALEEARRRLRFLHALGALELGAIDQDAHVRWAARGELALEAARDPHERRLSDDVRKYLSRLVALEVGEFGQLFEKPPPMKKGHPSAARRNRNIAKVILRLKNSYGLAPSRNREHANKPKLHQQPTACGLVAQALGELEPVRLMDGRVGGRICLDERSVETIWSRRPKDLVDDLPKDFHLSPKYRAWIERRLAQFKS